MYQSFKKGMKITKFQNGNKNRSHWTTLFKKKKGHREEKVSVRRNRKIVREVHYEY